MEQGEEAEFPIGERIAGTPYRVRGVIGSGGMGFVYDVEHEELGKRFVLKALRAELAERVDLAARMRNEWRALGRLQHPNIVVVTDAGQTAGAVPYYVMERLEGETLASRLKREGSLSLPLSLRLCAGLLDGLAAAHAIGIIHRDVKPQNVFLPAGGEVKLLDFGIAKLKDQAAFVVTRRGAAIGTPRYMSPEQARGRPVDGRADIYAVGLVLFELLAGRGPFAHHRDPNALVLAHSAEEPPRLGPEVPEEVAELVQRWLSKDPAVRAPDAASAARQVRRILRRFGFPSGVSGHGETLSAGYDATTRVEAGPAPGRAVTQPRSRQRPPAVHPLAQLHPLTQPTPAHPTSVTEPTSVTQPTSVTESRSVTQPTSATPPPVVAERPAAPALLSWPRWVALAGGAASVTFLALLASGAGEGPAVSVAGSAPIVVLEATLAEPGEPLGPSSWGASEVPGSRQAPPSVGDDPGGVEAGGVERDGAQLTDSGHALARGVRAEVPPRDAGSAPQVRPASRPGPKQSRPVEPRLPAAAPEAPPATSASSEPLGSSTPGPEPLIVGPSTRDEVAADPIAPRSD